MTTTQQTKPFREQGCFYRLKHSLCLRSSLDEVFENPVEIPKGSQCVVERLYYRPMALGESFTAAHAVIRIADPRQSDLIIRFGYWIQSGNNSFEKITNPLVILALAGTGIVL